MGGGGRDIRFILKSRGGGGDGFLHWSPGPTGAAAAVNKRYYPLAPQPRCGTTQICWLQGEQFNNLPVLVPSHPCFRHQSRRGFGLTGGILIDLSIGKASPPLGTTRALPVYVVSLVLRLPLFLSLPHMLLSHIELPTPPVYCRHDLTPIWAQLLSICSQQHTHTHSHVHTHTHSSLRLQLLIQAASAVIFATSERLLQLQRA